MAKPPVDPADVLAAKQDPALELARMPIPHLIAALSAGIPDQITREKARHEFHERLQGAPTQDLLTGAWLINSSRWLRREISREYVARQDAGPHGVVLLYRYMQNGEQYEEDDRLELLRLVFSGQEKSEYDKTWVWDNPVAELFTADHLAEMYEKEQSETNRGRLAGRYAKAPGARIGFLITALTTVRWWNGHEQFKSVVITRIKQLLPELSDKELRDRVAESLGNSFLLAIFLAECRARNTIRPADYRQWAKLLKSTNREGQSMIQEGLEGCYARMPFAKLVVSLQPIKFRDDNAKHLVHEAMVNVIRRRLGEAGDDQLVVLYGKAHELCDVIILLYGRVPNDEEERKAKMRQVLRWAANPDYNKRQSLLAFTAIGLGATAKQVELIYPKDSKTALKAPDVRVFTAYSAFPGSDKNVILRWFRSNPELLRRAQGVVTRREDITAADLEPLIEKDGVKEYNRLIFEVYCRKPDADPKKMIQWFATCDFVTSETLAGIITRFEPKPADVCWAVEASKKDFRGARELVGYAKGYFVGKPAEIEKMLDKYTEGPVHEVLVEAYKLTDEYKKEVARQAAEG